MRHGARGRAGAARACRRVGQACGKRSAQQAGLAVKGAQTRQGRATGGERAGVSGTIATTRPCWPATRSALAATRPGQGPRYGHCARLSVPVRAWVCSDGPSLGFGAL